MRDILVEIWESIKRNKLRTCLTGFAVAWGIFMLIVLLGAGNGLMNAFSSSAGSFASNSMMVGGGWTSKPYDGLKQGRRIIMEDKDIALTESHVFADNIDEVAATVGAGVIVTRGKKSFDGYIEGNYPGRRTMDRMEMDAGRFINDMDMDNSRKVVVLPSNVASYLLESNEKPADLVGQRIKVGDFSYLVVGITKSDNTRMEHLFYAPFTTVKTVFGKGKEIDDLTFTFHGLESEEENEQFEKDYKAKVNLLHRAAPDDERAIWIWNRFRQNLQMNKASHFIKLALWIIGLFTLLSGIVGVSNIMLITVKERTHEFGIRKAIGASPWSVTKLIITESVAITAFFGYVGMILGLVACEILDKTVGQSTQQMMGMTVAMLKDPTVGVDVAIEATVLLVVAGTVAGLIPALKAAKVKPIEALRAE